MKYFKMNIFSIECAKCSFRNLPYHNHINIIDKLKLIDGKIL